MSCTPHLSKHRLFYHFFLLHKFKMMTSSGTFFIFLKFWSKIFWSKKMIQNDKTNLSHSVSQELFLRWVWFLVHMCKMMISPVTYLFIYFFHFFKILIFQVFQSSSINVKRKSWGFPHLLLMCVIFFCIFIQSFQKFRMQYYVACQLRR